MVSKFINNEANIFLLRYFFVFFLLFTLTGIVNVFAQNKQAAIWHVGNKKLDFNTNPITVTDVVSPFLGIQSSIALADTSGQLLFFYSGNSIQKIYDKNYNELPNGQNINLLSPLFVPKPFNKKLFYLIDNNRYTLIDTSLNNNNGDVLEKDIYWNSIIKGSIQAVHHANCNDIWLIGLNDTTFISYLLTINGISTEPVITKRLISDAILGNNILLSPNGEYYAICGKKFNGGTNFDFLTFDFGKFDKQSGSFNRIYYYQTSTYSRAFHFSFSPDNTKLYFNAQLRTNNNNYQLIQINILNGIPDFNNSIIILNYNPSSALIPSGGMQIGNDGKIYELFMFQKMINVINNPNDLGNACNYQQNILTTNTILANLPNFITTWFSDNYCVLDFFSDNNCFTKTSQFSINNTSNIQSVLWNFGDSQTSTELNPSHIYTTTGTYTVTLIITFTNASTQTITKQVVISEIPNILTIYHK